MFKFKLLLTSIFLLLSLQLVGEEMEFKVVALFKNAVMIEHGSKQKMIRKGQTYKQIKLLSADSHGAKFLINGKPILLGLHESKIGNHFSNEKPVEKKSVSILRGNSGMYTTVGFINGVQVNFLVDTGASSVAMNERTAKRIGIQYKLHGQKFVVSTASGKAYAWHLNVKKVSVGGLEALNVEAAVVKGDGPNEVLLGMSFLRQFTMQDDGRLLKLTKKF